ncbi:MAG: efflux RND transporter periplasmic adaptor subunit [Verrucomicrobiota bacterium]
MPIVRPAKLIEVELADKRESRSYPAEIEAEFFRTLSFQQGGLVLELPVVEGKEVEKGALIAKLDQRDYKNQYDSAKSQFDNATEEYERAERLIKEDAIARSVLEQRKATLDVAKATLDSAEKAFSETELFAPFSGVISKVNIEELERVMAGQSVVSFFSNKRMQLSVDLPAIVLARIKGREDRRAVVVLDADRGTEIEAEFKEATLEADVSSQTFTVKYTFVPPEDLLILPGMGATITLSSSKIGDAAPTLRVPLMAVLSDGSKLYVWVYDEGTSTVSKREVTKADSIGETVVIASGLEPGEVVIAAGVSYLAEGMEVRPWTEED